MSYIYRLAGDNLELAEAELDGFLESQGINETSSRDDRIAYTDSEPGQLKRLALTHEVSKKIFEGSLDNYEPDLEIDGSFKVKIHDLCDKEVDKLSWEKELGSMIAGEVDLDHPDTVIHFYFLEPDHVVAGKEVIDIPRGLFNDRKNQERPFSSPVSMDPILARVLVNLSGVKPGEHLLDPFCGTGGILIEAGLCGVGVHGIDFKPEMVEGCRENLEEYGIISHDIREIDIKNTGDEFNLENFSVVVSDIPYGKASKTSENSVENFLELVNSFDGRVVFMYDEPNLGDYSSDYSVYVHGSLTRYIYIS